MYLGKRERAEVGIWHITIVGCIFLCPELVRFESVLVETACFLGYCGCLWIRRRFEYSPLTRDLMYWMRNWVGILERLVWPGF
jgi:hypothetical protein